MTRALHHAAVVALVLALGAPTVACAQSSEFEEHLRRGVELRRAGSDQESIAEFEAAHRLSSDPRAAAQLGLAYQAVGRWVEADRLLHAAMASPDDAWVARNRGALEGALAVVAGHVGSLEVHGDVAGAELRVDGAVVATLPMAEPTPVLAGVVTMELSAPGYEPVTRRFVVEPGVLVREVVTLRRVQPRTRIGDVTPAAVTPSTPPHVQGTETPSRAVGAAVSFAGAAVAWGFGGVSIALREGVATDYNHHTPPCPPPPAPAGSACAELEGAEAGWRIAAWVAFPVGAALAVTGALLLWLPARGRRGATAGCAPDLAGAGVTCAAVF